MPITFTMKLCNPFHRKKSLAAHHTANRQGQRANNNASQEASQTTQLSSAEIITASRGIGREIGRESTEIFTKFCAEKFVPALILAFIINTVYDLTALCITNPYLREEFRVILFFFAIFYLFGLLAAAYYIFIQIFVPKKTT